MKQHTPPLVAWLGYGGLLPFAAAALGALLDGTQRSVWQHALLSYGAIILSFVGALHWALAMREDDATAASRLYAWSVVPALAGWLALLLPLLFPQGMALAALVLIVAFAAHYGQDWRLARRMALPAWYLPLRLHLSSGAVLALAVLAATA
ncbi:MAG: DUF3429 domain-containing protein [Curvibacter sp.]|nr:DUF3429 domain-containing protein [Curvibacter sp.]